MDETRQHLRCLPPVLKRESEAEQGPPSLASTALALGPSPPTVARPLERAMLPLRRSLASQVIKNVTLAAESSLVM